MHAVSLSNPPAVSLSNPPAVSLSNPVKARALNWSMGKRDRRRRRSG